MASSPPNSPPPPFEAYPGDEPYVFVSYSHQDRAAVYPEIERLHKSGFRIWYDQGVPAGRDFTEYLEDKVDASAVLLAFLSPRAVDSRHVRNEINHALDRNKPYLAVYLEKTALRHGLAMGTGVLQAVPKFQMSEEVFRRTLDESLRRLLAGAPPSPVPTDSHFDPTTLAGFPFRQLFRMETRTGQKDDPTLIIDLGFMRAKLRNRAGTPLPMVCGCESVRYGVHLDGGRSRADPVIESKPDGARVIIEFGTGPDPSIRLEAGPPHPYLEGRTQMAFRIDWEDEIDDAGRARHGGTVTIIPDWFFVGGPGINANRAPLEVEVLVNVFLDRLLRRARRSHKFSF